MMLPQGQKQDPGLKVLGKQCSYHYQVRTIEVLSTIEYIDTKVLSSLTLEDIADVSDEDQIRPFLCLLQTQEFSHYRQQQQGQKVHKSAQEAQKSKG